MATSSIFCFVRCTGQSLRVTKQFAAEVSVFFGLFSDAVVWFCGERKGAKSGLFPALLMPPMVMTRADLERLGTGQSFADRGVRSLVADPPPPLNVHLFVHY